MPEISIHNSAMEVAQTEDVIRAHGFVPHSFRAPDGGELPYCRFTAHEDMPGPWTLLLYLHGMGSVGSDNWLQARIPCDPLTRYFASHRQKTAVLLPQCANSYYWVDVPWSEPDHVLPEKPSVYMARCMALLNAECAELHPARVYGVGVSMGGYGVWDILCRMPDRFDGIVSLCGGGDVRQAPNLLHTGIRMDHGDQDGAVPVVRSRAMHAALQAAGHPHEVYHELAGVGHNVWDPFFADDSGLEWLFACRRGFTR